MRFAKFLVRVHVPRVFPLPRDLHAPRALRALRVRVRRVQVTEKRSLVRVAVRYFLARVESVVVRVFVPRDALFFSLVGVPGSLGRLGVSRGAVKTPQSRRVREDAVFVAERALERVQVARRLVAQRERVALDEFIHRAVLLATAAVAGDEPSRPGNRTVVLVRVRSRPAQRGRRASRKTWSPFGAFEAALKRAVRASRGSVALLHLIRGAAEIIPEVDLVPVGLVDARARRGAIRARRAAGQGDLRVHARAEGRQARLGRRTQRARRLQPRGRRGGLRPRHASRVQARHRGQADAERRGRGAGGRDRTEREGHQRAPRVPRGGVASRSRRRRLRERGVRGEREVRQVLRSGHRTSEASRTTRRKGDRARRGVSPESAWRYPCEETYQERRSLIGLRRRGSVTHRLRRDRRVLRSGDRRRA